MFMGLEYGSGEGKETCSAIYSGGVVGQVVILDHVSFGDNPDPEVYPLGKYLQPYAFTIVGITEEEDCYLLRDADGVEVKSHDGAYLFDAKEWLTWSEGRREYQLWEKADEISILNAKLNLLKEILIAQGVKVVTQAQFDALGLKK